MQLNPLQVVLSDMHHAGVSDAVTDNPFDFFTQKIENPFADDMASEQPAMATPVAAATQTVERTEQRMPQQPAATPKVQTKTETAPKARDVADLVWRFGAKDAAVEVVISSYAQKGVHPLSVQAKSLFEKMLAAIGLAEDQVAYVVLANADKFSSVEKALAQQYGSALGQASHKLFVGEGAVKCLLDKTLIRARVAENDFHGQKVGMVMHPESLLTQPALKKMAWQDLLSFQNLISGNVHHD